LNFLGFGKIYEAWKIAQRMRKSVLSESAGPILEALQQFNKNPIKEVVMEEGEFADIQNVAEVVKATYGYTSLTATPADVTAQIAKRLVDNTVKLSNLKSAELQKPRRGSVAMFDTARKVLTMNTNRLTVQYRPLLDGDPAFMSKVENLLDKLTECGLIKSLHKSDGHLTYYKLPEWMQVEITQIFGESMNHTPWYRFPFMDFIGLYFRVFLKEVNVVRKEHGLAKALLSNAFLTDLVPGIVMFFLFSQMQLLALPVKAYGGTEYAAAELMVEQVVLLVPDGKSIDWKKLDDRIVAVEQAVDGEGLYLLTVPTFKPLTEILLKIAKEHPASQTLEISNQRYIQVKLLLPVSSAESKEKEAALIEKLNAAGGFTVLFKYRFPVDGTPNPKPPLCVAVKSATCALIRLINLCWQLDIEVVQIYDFFN